jgi:hypothetical protein
MAAFEIDTINELHNPIKRKISDITKQFPHWPMLIVFPQEISGYLTGTFSLIQGFKKVNGKIYSKRLLEFELKIRNVGAFDSDSIFLFNTIGEYFLARKTEKELGTDRKLWHERYEKAEWTS